ncbi:MAG: hypothetical protein ACRDQ9_16095, partial [Pseudonocardiaceae bacterium]
MADAELVEHVRVRRRDIDENKVVHGDVRKHVLMDRSGLGDLVAADDIEAEGLRRFHEQFS